MLKISFDTNGARALSEMFNLPIKRIVSFFKLAGARQLADIEKTFKGQGLRNGVGGNAWPRFSKLTLYPHWKAKHSAYPEYKGWRYNPEKANHRYGTDWSKTRMYTPGDKLLNASGSFRQSFRFLKISNAHVVVGTNYHGKKGVTAEDIMSTGGGRQVVFFTGQDKDMLGRLFVRFAKTEMEKAK